jgi:hypothetical protein
MIYMQVTRGAADRDFAYPEGRRRPSSPSPRPSPWRTRRRPRRHPGHHRARHPLGPPRHQDGPAPRAVDVQDDGAARRQGRCLDGRGRLRDRGHVEQRLHRHRRRRHRHPRPLERHPARDHPRGRARLRPRGADARRGAPLHGRRGPRRGRPSSPPPRPSSRRSSRSTAPRSATAGPARSRGDCASSTWPRAAARRLEPPRNLAETAAFAGVHPRVPMSDTPPRLAPVPTAPPSPGPVAPDPGPSSSRCRAGR